MEILIKNLKKMMKEKEMTQSDLAELLSEISGSKVKQGYISQLLNHKYETIQLDRLFQLAKAFNCNVSRLLE